MKKTIIKMIIVSIVFFIGTVSIISLDNICLETTGQGGHLVSPAGDRGMYQ